MPASPPVAADQAIALLHTLGAADIDHPGGTLVAHLQRVQGRLAVWGARPALRLAGLCHAFYGTDGFPTALLSPDSRTELAGVIGAEAEAIVYLYASCDRKATYPTLADADGAFRNRFTGRLHTLEPQQRRDFAELSAANELDLARIDSAFREKWGAELLALFTRFRPLLSEPAWSDCQAVLRTRSAPGVGASEGAPL
ncbi:DUF6817 domain-containing protein [Streptomyces purpurascens]|uniref:DUF6817 domain-containing protein n=1 Tax=Streptomyces purpurascens TaxID=1924 RepID=A0ABZ1MJP4_STREF|nr:hypothetical protein [Streptomyces purpurascens]MCE7051141.1 hypothetical protein [Streptomyces purpurascens]GHA53062.1 hypothetical protein GCM10010303_76310 [Streptomyces purpurascens]